MTPQSSSWTGTAPAGATTVTPCRAQLSDRLNADTADRSIRTSRRCAEGPGAAGVASETKILCYVET